MRRCDDSALTDWRAAHVAGAIYQIPRVTYCFPDDPSGMFGSFRRALLRGVTHAGQHVTGRAVDGGTPKQGSDGTYNSTHTDPFVQLGDDFK